MTWWRTAIVSGTGHLLIVVVDVIVVIGSHQEAIVIVFGVVAQQTDVVQCGGHRRW